MCLIVCIDTLTKRTVNNLMDIVDVFEDGHVFGSHIYDAFVVINLPGIEAAFVRDAIRFVRSGLIDQPLPSKFPVRITATASQITQLEGAVLTRDQKIALLPNVMARN